MLRRSQHLWMAIMLMACTSAPGTIYETSGSSGSIVVEESAADMRTLRFGRNGARQSVVKPGDPDHIELSYARIMLAELALSGSSGHMLVLGLGGGSLPMFLRGNYPDAVIDAVEIDPDVVVIAKRFFGVIEDERLHIHIGDARRFVENSESGVYDLILVDAFGANNAPAHLTTQEFMRSLHKTVSSDDVVIGNLWRRAYNPDYDSMVLTYKSVFNQNILLDVTGDVNSIIIALPANTPINRERFAVAAGILERKLRFRFDLETLVRNAYQPISALELKGSILLDKNVKAAP